MDRDRIDVVKNVQACSKSQLIGVNPQSFTAAIGGSKRPLEENAKSSVNDVLTPFLSESDACGTPSLMMLPTSISDGSTPNILVTVHSCVKLMMLDSGAEISVAPLEMVQNFVPPINISSSVREVKTFENSAVDL